MSTPSTQGLATIILSSKDELTNERWLDLIRARRGLIKPHLESLTLPKLGDLGCLRSEISFTHALQLDNPTITGDDRFSLKTQGIFRVQPWSVVERVPGSGFPHAHCPNGTMRVWGLSRSGQWLLVTISFVGEAGYKDRGYERAKTVKIVEVNLSKILAETKEDPRKIWEELGKTIKAFTQRRKTLYKQAVGLAQIVEIEELALSLI